MVVQPSTIRCRQRPRIVFRALRKQRGPQSGSRFEKLVFSLKVAMRAKARLKLNLQLLPGWKFSY